MTSKPPIVSWVEDNFPDIECQTYGAISDAAYLAALGSAFTLNLWATAGAVAVNTAANYAAIQAGCTNDVPPPGPDVGEPLCWDCMGNNSPEPGDDNYGKLQQRKFQVDGTVLDWIDIVAPGNFNRKILSIEYGVVTSKDYSRDNITIVNYAGEEVKTAADYQPKYTKYCEYRLVCGNGCYGQGTPKPKTDEDPIGEPIKHVDGECEWSITPINSRINEGGVMEIYYKVEANDPSCGGPFYYWATNGGPEWVQPTTEPGPTPPPGSGSGCSCDKISDLLEPLNQKLDAILAKEESNLDGTKYLLQGICENVPPGKEQPVFEYPVAAGKASANLAERLDRLAEMLQKHLSLKTPICRDKPNLEGDWRTISFRSDSTSPYGNARLRKRFRYRSTSGLGLGEVVEHWKDFTYESGPVVVIHSGSSWGTPQVWADTADEGKRVIRHAAGEAGIDPDQVGRWTISGSDSARYGVSDKMRVDKRKGFWWITSRDGSDNRPKVAEASDP